MSQLSHYGRPIARPFQNCENSDITTAIRKTLNTTHLLLFYYEDQRPGPQHILSENLQIPLEKRGEIKVS